MRIDILTLFPEMFTGVFGCSIISRAVKGGYLELHTHDIRDYSTDKHRRVDDYPFGGGAGMVMMVEPIARCIEKLKAERKYDLVLFMAPDGKTFDQNYANRLSLMDNIMILCGHYKGVDERVRELLQRFTRQGADGGCRKIPRYGGRREPGVKTHIVG